MTDEKFAKFLYETAYNIPPINVTVDDFTAPQMGMATAIIAVRKIGEGGSLQSGLERLKNKFPTNFKPGSDILGKGVRGNKAKDVKKNYDNVLAVQKLINNGLSQNKACKEIGISAKRFRDIRDELLNL